jgi:diguanylate cyclase (GGDEF)-like protein
MWTTAYFGRPHADLSPPLHERQAILASRMEIVLIVIALQQGLFALGWWVAGWALGLSRRAAYHWVAATLAAALAIALVLQRGRWPDLLTVAVAHALAMVAFLAMRRGVQVFLRIATRDAEALALLGGVVVALGLFVADPSFGRVAVLAASSLTAWTLLRCAWEAHAALRHQGDSVAARVVAVPLALLGAVYGASVVFELLWPEGAARPLGEANVFDAGIVIAFMVVGLVLNLVLAYLVANRLVRRLHQLSILDPLTGLFNRRGLAPRLMREGARWRRYGERYAVLAVDIDRFKNVNDRHGHAAGDAVLVQLGALLRSLARDVDTVARLGGEEFCLVLAHCDHVGAEQVGERLCRLVRDTKWPNAGGPLTVSVGVAVVDGGESSAAVLQRADTALLRAKARGRDRVVIAG